MFHDISQSVKDRMKELEEIDARDRVDQTPRMERLRQIEPITGKFLALLASSAPEGRMIEIGTSAGYSALWLSLAGRVSGRKLTTYELLPEKIKLSRETFQKAGVNNLVELVEGDAREHLKGLNQIGFCFLDAEKEVYQECYDLVVPRLVSGGILVADNLISHADELADFAAYVAIDRRIDSVLVPIGKGELVCRRI